MATSFDNSCPSQSSTILCYFKAAEIIQDFSLPSPKAESEVNIELFLA